MEKQIFKYGSYSYEYYLVRQTRETISLIVHPSLKIVLKCPVNCNSEKLEKFLKKKWKWLEKQLSFFKKFNGISSKKECVSGESVLYLGRQHKLFIRKANKNEIKMKFCKILMHTVNGLKDAECNKKLLDKWYLERANIIFQEEYKKALKTFDYNFEPKLTIRKMNKRWGSFLSNRRIILNPVLIQAPKECINYVITHELCHMKYKNHNKFFYGLLKSKVNNWKEIKEKLELRFI